MAKYMIVVRATLQNEAGRDLTWEDWHHDLETDSPHGGGTWVDVQNAITDALEKAAPSESAGGGT